MIRISIGAVGSGKSATEVRNIILNPSKRKTYSNILMKNCRHNIKIDPSMIINKSVVGTKKKRSGDVEEVIKHELNKEFWQKINEPINIVLDEAHTLMNPRRAMSKINIIMTDFLALIRRVLGSNDAGEGEAVFITQLPRRLDPITRDMANDVRYHICHYLKECRLCQTKWRENSEMPDRIWNCPKCGKSKIKKYNFIIEVFHFASIGKYYNWYENKVRSYHKHYYINDIENYFPYYNTLQWDSMFSEYY